MKRLTELLNEALSIDEALKNIHGVDSEYSEDVKNIIEKAIDNGYVVFEGKEVGISKENIYDLFDEDFVGKEAIDTVVENLQKKGHNWMYESDNDIPKDYKQPKDLM